jgi:pantoate--beta-alanine ligase
MLLFKRGDELAGYLEKQRSEGKQIGFVPTMGALHAGHLSLIERSRSTAQVTVCSIFVNPTQFNDPKDFRKYPITIERDLYLLEKAAVTAVFLPEVEEIYPDGMEGLEKYDLGELETILEGKYRPGHFQGVCQAVKRLLDKVMPDQLFMGQKDYQQCLVVGRLLDLIGSATVLYTCPIVREPDGLAMSSRNLRLSDDDRKKAPAIYKALSWLKENREVKDGGQPLGFERLPGSAIDHARGMLAVENFRIDYLEIVAADGLGPLRGGEGAGTNDEKRDGGDEGKGVGKAIALVAAFLGEIRLIDNIFL